MMWSQAHRHRRLLFFFLTIIFITVSGKSVNSSITGCAPFNCASGDHFKYPFWQVGSSNYCGYPGLSLDCDDERPRLFLSGRDYVVKNINYSESSITLVDTNVWHNYSCPWPSSEVSLESTASLVVAQEPNIFVRFFRNCSRIPASLDNIRCPGESNDTLSSYMPEVRDLFAANHPVLECESDVMIPMLYTAFQRLKGSGWKKALQEGFKLHWRPDAACKYCEWSGGICMYQNDETGLNFSCTCPDRKDHPRDCNDGDGPGSTKKKALIGASIIVAAIVIILLFVWRKKLYSYTPTSLWKIKTNSQNVETFLENYRSLSPKRYRYSDIKKMTDCFKDKLGQGGYGGVFRGKLQDGRLVAVKILSGKKGDGEEFINEVATISRTNHLNIVSLLGFCSQGSKRALVYEFMPNGSLEKFIFSKQPSPTHPLGWEKLYQIALGIAKGLEYLHRGCSTRILHLDIKPHNILLDHDFCPKISDFGLAKLCPTRESVISMLGTRGTIGYIAPEVYCRNFGGVSYKSDVYSYGMMVLEMVGGRKNIDVEVEKTSEIYFPQWIYNRIEQQGDIGLRTFEEDFEEEIAKKMVLVGLWCIQTDPVVRPSMNKVVEMLEGSVQMPPKPFFDHPARSEG